MVELSYTTSGNMWHQSIVDLFPIFILVQTQVDNNMCFFMCYAQFLEPAKQKRFLKKSVKSTFLKFHNIRLKKPKKACWEKLIQNYQGMRMDHIARFEEKFQVSVWVYTLREHRGRTIPECIRQGGPEIKKVMRLCQCGDATVIIC